MKAKVIGLASCVVMDSTLTKFVRQSTLIRIYWSSLLAGSKGRMILIPTLSLAYCLNGYAIAVSINVSASS